MTTSGYLIRVEADPSRAFLTADVTAGATVLSITSGLPFSTGATSVLIDGAAHAITSLIIPEDEELSATLEVSPGVASALETNEPIDANPSADVTFGLVEVAGEEETTRVLIPQEMQDSLSLALGPHDIPEAVEFDDLGRGPELTWVEGRIERDGSYTDFTDVIIPPASLTDGLPPATSPTCTTLGSVGMIFVKWAAVVGNADPVTYDLHISTTSGFVPDTVAFTTRTIANISSNMAAVKQLPDGTALAYGVDYFFAIVARDADGQGPAGAVSAASRMSPATSPDIAVGAVMAVNILADAIDGMTITGSTFQTAATGQRLVWDSTGLFAYKSDESLSAAIRSDGSIFISGQADLTVLSSKKTSLGGVTSGEASGSFVASAGGVADPSMPPIHSSVPKAIVPLGGAALGPLASGAVWDAAGSRWWRARRAGTSASGGAMGVVFTRWSSAGVRQADVAANALTLRDGTTPTQFAMNATHAFVMWESDTTGVWVIERFPRPTSTTFSDADCKYVLPTVPGGYQYTPTIGLAGDGDLLVAYTVTGAQTIAGLSFADRDVFVGKYSMVKSGTALVLTATKTIRVANLSGNLASVKMDATNGCFDLTPVAANTGLLIAGRGAGIGAFSLDFLIVNVPNTGTAVTGGATGAGVNGWYAGDRLIQAVAQVPDRGGEWDGTYFWGMTPTGDLHQFTNGSVSGNDLLHGYSLYNSTTAKESAVSPLQFQPGGSFYKRHVSRWTIPILPPGVNAVRIYVGNDPARLRLERQGGAAAYYPGTAGSPLLVEANPTALPVGTANAVNPPPAVNNFGTGTPYEYKSETGGYSSKGDGTGGWPLMDQAWSAQDVLTATANPTSTTNITLAGLSRTITSPGTTAVWLIEIDAAVQIGVAGTLNLIELLVDGVATSGQLATSGPAGAYMSGHKKWRVTGLSAGAHTFTARTRNTAASTSASVLLVHTFMTVERKS